MSDLATANESALSLTYWLCFLDYHAGQHAWLSGLTGREEPTCCKSEVCLQLGIDEDTLDELCESGMPSESQWSFNGDDVAQWIFETGRTADRLFNPSESAALAAITGAERFLDAFRAASQDLLPVLPAFRQRTVDNLPSFGGLTAASYHALTYQVARRRYISIWNSVDDDFRNSFMAGDETTLCDHHFSAREAWPQIAGILHDEDHPFPESRFNAGIEVEACAAVEHAMTAPILTEPLEIKQLVKYFGYGRNKMSEVLASGELGAKRSGARWRVPIENMPPNYLSEQGLERR